MKSQQQTETLHIPDYVIGRDGKPSAVLVDLATWRAILDKLEDQEDFEILRASQAELTALAHDQGQTDWKSWEDDLRFTEKVLARIAEGAPTYSHENVWDEIAQREATGELSD